MKPYTATAVEIAALTGWSEAYVRRLASTHGWRRIGRKPVRYYLADVARTRGD